jgi:retron-type reverse transcriptase
MTLTFNINMSTAAVFFDIGKTFDTTWHSSLLYKLSKLEFSTNSQRKLCVSVECEISMPREMRVGVPQGSVLSPTLHNMYINDAPKYLVFT